MAITQEQLVQFCKLLNDKALLGAQIFDYEREGLLGPQRVLGIAIGAYGGCEFFVEGVAGCDLEMRCGSFTVWGLARLEEIWRGHWTERISNLEHGVNLVGATQDSPSYFVEITAYPESDSYASACTYPAAPTRAEAVFLALLQALESTTQTDALAIPDSSSAAQSTAAEGEKQGGSE